MVASSYSTPSILTTTYLEMTSIKQFEPAFLTYDDVRIERMDSADVGFYRYLYRSVGEKWCWRDRLLLSDTELLAELTKDSTHVYVMYVGGAPAGYIELAQSDDSTEIAYFGLREEYHGRGLGKHLLSFGIQKAWQEPATSRVWLHTCNLDGPHALANYCKRGFQVVERKSEPMPEIYQ